MPTHVGSYDTPFDASGIFVSGDYAYVADQQAGLQIIKINSTVSNVRWVNDGTITATFPSGLPAGPYHILVTNPGGQTEEGVLHNGYIVTKNLYEENDTVTYTGTWSDYTNPNLSSGAIKVSNQTNARAEFTFNGSGIKWIAAKARQLGKAKVYIDGVLQTTVDLFSATAKVKQTVYQKTWLTSGNHTIMIVVAGQKNISATGYNVDIDAFEVVP